MTPEQLKFTRSTDPRQQILISIQDVVRIEVSCKKCGTTLSLDTAAKKSSLDRETRCPECNRPLWKGGDDTRLPRQLLDAIFHRRRSLQVPRANPRRRCRARTPENGLMRNGRRSQTPHRGAVRDHRRTPDRSV